ncbi:kinase-like domain-containing protein [Fusarium oxysporum f. sp. albedinis]|nr:kinase-like domain-containing protein [Fusarium oxysporum]KAI3572898.1 kinase-like domain-containing protein [Fusarium oxysporum f. sp. albedinis]KAK2470503.1 hypothetical protein H9L39_18120 [Fusarium oxysporum f. sp. albedinis]
MDPLSIISGCAALITAIGSLTISINAFVRTCRDSRSDLDKVSRELHSLQNVLELIQEDAKDDAKPFPPAIEHHITSIVANCTLVVVETQSCIKKYGNGGINSKASWAINGQGDMEKLRSSLEAHKSALELALDMLTFSLAKDIKTDTTEIRNDTATIRDDTAQILQAIAQLQARLPDTAEAPNDFILQRFLEDMATYMEATLDADVDYSDHGRSWASASFSDEHATSPVDIISGTARNKSIVFDNFPPRWDDPDWLDKNLDLEGFCVDFAFPGCDLDAMMRSDDNIKFEHVKLSVNTRSKPFAEGSERIAAYARPAATTSKYVLKSSKGLSLNLAIVVEEMRIQALCKEFAREFNSFAKPPQPIDFITTLCLSSKSNGTAPDDHVLLEPYIEGEFVKYNSNGLYVLEDDDNPFNEVAQAFSHFTFERSSGNLLVNDIQRVGTYLIDPAVQTIDPNRFKLGLTNLNGEGYRFFFAMHKCGKTCHKLGLLSVKEAISSPNFSKTLISLGFRKIWPGVDSDICSNKLCRKMITPSMAFKSIERVHLIHSWCESCFLQLGSTFVKVTCRARGKEHTFWVSRFYYGSQGSEIPGVCEKHEEKSATDAGTTNRVALRSSLLRYFALDR